MRRAGFTLVEILLVVIILGLLAAIVLPQFSRATNDARLSAVSQDLQRVRRQLELFKAEHGGIPPQPVGMWGLLTGRSDTSETAVAAGTGTVNGPYLATAPENPWNGKTAVSTGASDTNAGWYYTATTTAYTFQARNADGTVITQY